MGERVVENLLLIVDYIGAGIALIIIMVVVYLMYLQYRGEQAEWEARRDHEAMQKSIKEGNKEDDSARNRRL
jgi:hypothetical protein